MWNKIGLGAAFLVVIASPVALHAVSAAPQRVTPPAAQVAAAQSFVPVCKASEAVDTRPDPAWVDASFAHDNCVAPTPPVPMDGYTATREQIVAGMAAEKRYEAEADSYQRCVAGFVALNRTKAGKAQKTQIAALITIENHRIIASQENQKKADALIKGEIEAFNEYGSECL